MGKLSDLMRGQESGSPAPSDSAMQRFFSEIGSELKHQAEAGAHEMAAALFRGDSFVMYGERGGVEQQPAAAQQQEQQPELTYC